MDVKSEFLNGELEEEVYIEHPEGCPLTDDKGIVCKLKKALYSLKQAPSTWYARLDKHLTKLGYRKGMENSNLCWKEIDDGLMILVIFVDDIIFGGNDDESENFVEEMKKEFEMSMIGEIKYFLGFQIVKDKEGIIISQTNYLKYLLKRFGLETCKLVGTLMVTRHKLSTKDEIPTIEQKKYRSMIEGLQYLTHTRPDITNAVGIVARFQANPREVHYATVKRIFRYLKGMTEFILWYDRSNDFTLYAYTNADWVGRMDDRKRTSGGAFFLGGRLVFWLRKKQDCTSQSIIEAEYVVVEKNCNQVVWMK